MGSTVGGLINVATQRAPTALAGSTSSAREADNDKNADGVLSMRDATLVLDNFLQLLPLLYAHTAREDEVDALTRALFVARLPPPPPFVPCAAGAFKAHEAPAPGSLKLHPDTFEPLESAAPMPPFARLPGTVTLPAE
jgi:hypothetical protein